MDYLPLIDNTLGPVTEVGEIIDVSSMAQGDGPGQRDGNFQVNKRLKINVCFYGTNINTTGIVFAPTQCRVIVFIDKNATISQVPDVLQESGNLIGPYSQLIPV